jgi:hypothetical protein
MGMTNLRVDAGRKIKVWQEASWWFWAAIVIGIIIRVYLVVFTEGTYDVNIWQQHVEGIHKYGLIGYYHTNPLMNHPPFISVAISLLLRVAETTGVPFKMLLRAPFALLDAGTALLLFYLFGNKWYRFGVAACYWLHPLTMIFSSYHGNTDSAIAFSLLLCVWLLLKEKPIWAAVALGASFWVKLPGVMAIPAFVFFVQGWRKRLLFLAVAGAVGVSTYIPAFLEDAAIICKNVFGYHGQFIKTTAGIPVWGTRIFIVPSFQYLPLEWQKHLHYPLAFLIEQSSFISIVLIILLSWLRRSRRTTNELGTTIAAAYTILYGFSNYWAFQYFAWSVPFWFFTRRRFFIPATVLASGYIYSLYWLVCGNPWLLGNWDFIGHPYWSEIVIVFRNLTVLFFFISACIFLLDAACEQIARWCKQAKDNHRVEGK